MQFGVSLILKGDLDVLVTLEHDRQHPGELCRGSAARDFSKKARAIEMAS